MSGELILTLKVEMDSDWAIGSGIGRQGALDSLVERDRYGLPFVPATTLRGMWRDAAETVARGLDDGNDSGWHRAVDHLFGSQPAIDPGTEGEAHDRRMQGPVASRLKVEDARYPDLFGAWLKDNDRSGFRGALTFVKPGVMIDTASGSAKQDYLRFDEYARKGATLTATARFALCGRDAEDEALAALALASLLLLERLGGDRRRGAGACAVTVAADGGSGTAALPSTAGDAVAWLRDNATPPRFLPADGPAAAPAYGAARSNARFHRFALDVEVLSPTTIGEAVHGNVTTTRDHIPGVYLLHVAVRLAAALGLDRNAIGTAIACGDIRVLPACPEIDGERALPVPAVIERRKDAHDGERARFRNRLVDGNDKDTWNAIRGTYCSARIDKGLRLATATETLLRTHNAVDDKSQKPKQGAGGGVYVLESISPGTRLKSEFWIRRDEELAKDRRDSLVGRTEKTSIGLSKKSGYGQVEVSVAERLDDMDASHAAIGADAANGRRATSLWVASDIVLPPGAGAIDGAIRRLLETAGLACEIDIERSEIRIGRIEGWIGSWALPRPTLVTIQAGSVIVLDRAADADVLARIAADGLGDRRAEGFGHVLVDPKLLNADRDMLDPVVLVEASRPAGEETERDTDARVTFDRMPDEIARHVDRRHIEIVERAALETAIASAAEYAVSSDEKRKELLGWSAAESTPRMSQLGNLRSAIGELTEPGDVQVVFRFLEGIRKDGRAGSWGGGDVVEKAKALFDKDGMSRLWEALADGTQLDLQLRRCLVLRTVADVKADEAVYRKGLLMLFHAAMRAHKRAIEKQARQSGKAA